MARPAKVIRDKIQAQWPGATVIIRGRGGITHKHPTEPNRFALDSSIDAMHYDGDQEIDTAWQPGTAPWDFEMTKAKYNAFALENFSSGQIVKYVDPASGEDITFQPQQLQYTNDLSQIQAIANPQSVSAVVQDEDALFWSGAYGPGFDLRWRAAPSRLDKRLIVDQASRFPAPEQFIIDGGNPVFKLPLIFSPSNGLDIYVNDVLWERKPNSLVDTSARVEFRSKATGEILWTFRFPGTTQEMSGPNSGEQFKGQFRLRRTGPNLFVEHRIPISWIQSADYPIEIDATLEDSPAESADDASEVVATGSMDLTDTFIRFGFNIAAVHIGLRFGTISGLSGVTINADTYIQGNDIIADVGDFVADFFAHDTAAPGVFTTTDDDITDRVQTTATCEGDGEDFGDFDGAGTWQFFGDGVNTIADIIQELADSYDPSAIALLHIYTSGTGERLTHAEDHAIGSPILLHIDYTAAAAIDSPDASFRKTRQNVQLRM